MMSADLDADRDQRFVSALRQLVTGAGEGDTAVLDVEADVVDDATGTPAWRVTLVLPVPSRGAWAVDKTRELKRDARRAADEVATSLGLVLDGLTTVTLTAKDVDDQDLAPEDEPESGENGTAFNGQETSS
jgi:hypothetical protein